MTPAALATFLREEVPHLVRAYPALDWANPTPFRLLEALTATVALLREAAQVISNEWPGSKLAETLREVVGEEKP